MSQDGKPAKVAAAASDDDSSSSSYSDEEDEDLVLEGVLVRNPDASDSSSDEDSCEEDPDETTKPPAKKQKKNDTNESLKSTTRDPAIERKDDKQSTTKNQKQLQKKNKKKKKKEKNSGPEIVDMEFTFCDMDEKFFHGIKNLLASSSPAYGATASGLTDLMIENAAVGTVISTDYSGYYQPGQQKDPDYEGVVYGFASVLNVSTHGDSSSIQALKKLCLSKCPGDRKKELETVLSGTTKRPAGFYFQSRMVNLPLEIVEVLHQQLVMDMDWAVENAAGQGKTKEETERLRKSLDFGAFVRIAPTYREKSGTASYYKYFDDELLANHAEFAYEIELPKTFGMEETPYCTVIVATKTGHRAAVQQLREMVGGG